jgi:hypothetical protein
MIMEKRVLRKLLGRDDTRKDAPLIALARLKFRVSTFARKRCPSLFLFREAQL